MTLDEVVASLLPRCQFPAAEQTVTCGVSGGADSLTLLVLARAAGLDVVAVHVDHGIRPGSEAEAAVVVEAAERFGADFRAETVCVAPGPDLEARARRLRHEVLGPDALLGHTADDQAETVLASLVRGAALDGLAGIRPDRRPLLALRRSETEAVVAAAGLRVVADPSNRDPAYQRNRLRHEALPLLSDIGGRDVRPILARQAALLRADADYLESVAAALDPTDAKAIASAPLPLARRALRTWIRSLDEIEAHPPDAAAVERVLAVARGDAVATHVAGGWEVRRSAADCMSPPLRRGHVGDCTRRNCGRPLESKYGPGVSFLESNVGPVVVGKDDLVTRVTELGARIAADYAGRDLLLIAVLKGAYLFLGDLSRAISTPHEIDFMAVSSYGDSTRSSGVVRIVKDLDIDLSGRDVVLVEDIVDSGLTLRYLRKTLEARNPASFEVCALLVRQGNQEIDVALKYTGFEIPPAFVIGYGLDVAGYYRNLPQIHEYLG